MSNEDVSAGTISADISITTTLPASHSARERLNSAVLAVMNEYAKLYVADWKENWTGWKYAGRPAGAPRLVSHREWKATASPTTEGAQLVVKNNARDWRKGTKDYVAHVHRSGSRTPEWMVVKFFQAGSGGIDARFVRAITEAVFWGVGPQTSRKVGDQRGTSGSVQTGATVVF